MAQLVEGSTTNKRVGGSVTLHYYDMEPLIDDCTGVFLTYLFDMTMTIHMRGQMLSDVVKPC